MAPGGGKGSWSVPGSFWRLEDGMENIAMVVVALRDSSRRRYITRGDAPLGSAVSIRGRLTGSPRLLLRLLEYSTLKQDEASQ